MAERSTNPLATIWQRLSHPVDTIRNNISAGASEWRAHPIQEGLQRLIGFGAGAATANPAVGSAAGSAADRFFNWWNNRGNNNFGPGSGMSGITSPYTGSQSEMGAALGIPDYLNGQIPQGQQSQPGQPAQQDDPNEHPSQLRPSGATVTTFGGQPQAPAPTYQGQQGAATSLGNMGRTVGTASMGQVEDMLGAGIGRSDIASRLTQSREVSQMRDQARANGPRPPGMTVMQWLQQNS